MSKSIENSEKPFRLWKVVYKVRGSDEPEFSEVEIDAVGRSRAEAKKSAFAKLRKQGYSIGGFVSISP